MPLYFFWKRFHLLRNTDLLKYFSLFSVVFGRDGFGRIMMCDQRQGRQEKNVSWGVCVKNTVTSHSGGFLLGPQTLGRTTIDVLPESKTGAHLGMNNRFTYCFFKRVLWSEPNTSCTLSMCSTSELQPSSMASPFHTCTAEKFPYSPRFDLEGNIMQTITSGLVSCAEDPK